MSFPTQGRPSEEYGNPTNDHMFKSLFGLEKNKDLIKDFLNDIIYKNKEDKIEVIELNDPHQFPEDIYDKACTVDVSCKDNSNRHYIIEMQVLKRPKFEKGITVVLLK